MSRTVKCELVTLAAGSLGSTNHAPPWSTGGTLGIHARAGARASGQQPGVSRDRGGVGGDRTGRGESER